MAAVPITRSAIMLQPDPKRLITKPYVPIDVDAPDGDVRALRLIERTLAMSPGEVTATLDGLAKGFGVRHADLDAIFIQGFAAVAHLIPEVALVPSDRLRLIGAYFVHEYSIEAAALTNPSIVPHPDQTGVPAGSLRVIVSLRAIGEGHISSIEFRTGLLAQDGTIDIASPSEPISGHRRSPIFDKTVFTAKLTEMGVANDLVHRVLIQLEERFVTADLEAALADLGKHEASPNAVHNVTKVIRWLASSNYEVSFPRHSDPSQRVLIPSGPTESRGMEDARLVRFTEDDGSVIYYAPYTAYDGFNILPQLIETTDFETFRIGTLNGQAASNKGIALFPRRIAGRYAALSRCDGESNFLMLSDHIRFWHDAEPIQLPSQPWELMQVGNAGSPIETAAGWLVITHGVGPMRQYALGAILLDIDDPRQVIGHLESPLLVPNEQERDGYVPNVVYSCGSLVHGGRVVIAYGASDTSTSFASVDVETLLAELTRN
jgi:predicted GH43/DUF377 family glycosyl hydrolase